MSRTTPPVRSATRPMRWPMPPTARPTRRGTPPADHVGPADGSCYHRPAMTTAHRFYLTTAIAYANNQPGLHTLLDVIGADVIARWYRMLGTPTRFLTGTDEHS